MILADTSVWADHLRSPIPEFVELLNYRRILGHVCVRGELSLGSLAARADRLRLLDELPQAGIVDHAHVFDMIEHRGWWSRGIGYVDAQLLASTLIMPSTKLWSRDKALAKLANECGVGFVC